MSGGGKRKNRQYVNAITGFQEFRYEGPKWRELFFITPQTDFSKTSFSVAPSAAKKKKRFPPGSILHPPAD